MQRWWLPAVRWPVHLIGSQLLHRRKLLIVRVFSHVCPWWIAVWVAYYTSLRRGPRRGNLARLWGVERRAPVKPCGAASVQVHLQ